MSRTLVAGVGNLLRRDDGFGVAVAQALLRSDELPANVDVIETGANGLAIVQQLMDGYDALIVVDAVDRGAAPGMLFTIRPDVREPAEYATDEWRAEFSDLHLAEPSRVFVLARALGVLPTEVLLLGCQVQDADSLEDSLTPAVAAAVPLACERVLGLLAVRV